MPRLTSSWGSVGVLIEAPPTAARTIATMPALIAWGRARPSVNQGLQVLTEIGPATGQLLAFLLASSPGNLTFSPMFSGVWTAVCKTAQKPSRKGKKRHAKTTHRR